MAATESNRRSASLKISALPFRGFAQKYPNRKAYIIVWSNLICPLFCLNRGESTILRALKLFNCQSWDVMCKYSDLIGYKCPHENLKDNDYCIFHLQDDNKDVDEFNKRIKEILETGDDLINCNGFYFPPGTGFRDTKFLGNVNFSNAIFSKEADFQFSKFSGNVNFFDSNFSGNVNFMDTIFLKEANFDSSKFSGNANFWGSKFLKYASFSLATFSKEANFVECTPNTGQVVKQHYINLTLLHIQSVVDILSSNAVSFHYRHSR